MTQPAVPPPGLPPRPTPWGVIFAAWTLYGLLNAAQQNVLYTLSRDAPLPFTVSLLLQMPLAYTWALATPGILWLGRRFPFEKGKWPLSVAVHVVVSLSLVFLLDLGYSYHASNVVPPAGTPLPVWRRAVQLFEVWVLSDGLLYWMVLIVGYAAEQLRRSRERALVASQLETQLVQADLQALKAQLHPHFLFNALHTIGSLARTGDREQAVRVTAGLGDLLRRMLDGAGQQEVPLKQELDFIRNYLDIECVRFQDRLKVAISAPPETLDARVPHLILQPLVENAIRHGIAPHLFAGLVVVAARRIGDRLCLSVRDDGPGVGRGDAARPGVGLSNTRARLTRLYGTAYTLDVVNAPEGGLEARIELPYRLAAAEWEGGR